MLPPLRRAPGLVRGAQRISDGLLRPLFPRLGLLVIENPQQVSSPLDRGHRAPALPCFGLPLERALQDGRRLPFHLHCQQHAFHRQIRPFHSGLCVLWLRDPVAKPLPDRRAELLCHFLSAESCRSSFSSSCGMATRRASRSGSSAMSARPPSNTPAPRCMVLFTSSRYPNRSLWNSDVRNAKPLIEPRTRSRSRFGQAFAGSKGTRTMVQFRRVPSCSRTPRNLRCALTAPASRRASENFPAASARSNTATRPAGRT